MDTFCHFIFCHNRQKASEFALISYSFEGQELQKCIALIEQLAIFQQT